MATATPVGFSAPPPAEARPNTMDTQVKVVAVLNLVAGTFALVSAVFLLFVFGVGTVATEDSTQYGTPEWVPGVVASLGLILGLLFAAIAALSIAAGLMLLNRKRAGKSTGILASVLHILNFAFFPFSTALGIYGLVVLLNRDTEALLVD